MAIDAQYAKSLERLDRQYEVIEQAHVDQILRLIKQIMLDTGAVITFAKGSPLSMSIQVDDLIDSYEGQLASELRQMISDIHDVATVGLKSVFDTVGEPVDALGSDDILQGAIAGAGLLATIILANFKSITRASIRLGGLGGLQTSEIMKQIRNGFARQAVRLRRFLRTEATRIFNMSHLALAKVENRFRNDALLKGWVTVGDNRVRPTHRQAGKSDPIPLAHRFRVGSSLMRYPGDPRGAIEEIINCRCRLRVFHPKAII